ncbi:hypothetical protein [Spirosoma endophyticum]|uniref:hypothetical protein n=1 Tax=Spirosoma endophyticum TaxID=662367 RepID=UPI0015A6AF31|nr:hypothetical protein [Spirosoma endophyticum]
MGKQTATLLVINSQAAAIDIGSCKHWVAIDQNKSDGRCRKRTILWGVYPRSPIAH